MFVAAGFASEETEEGAVEGFVGGDELPGDAGAVESRVEFGGVFFEAAAVKGGGAGGVDVAGFAGFNVLPERGAAKALE